MLDPTQVAATIYQASAEQATKSFDRQTRQMDSVAKMRLEFFDRIALLDGGTIALSVTLIGSLASRNPHVPMKWVTLLILSWMAFVLSMLLALTRNYIEHDRLSTAEYNNYFLALSQSFGAMAGLAQAVSGATPEVEQANKILADSSSVLRAQIDRHKSLLWWTKFTGIASLAGILAGFILLLFFATKNIAFL
jgi:hypothetical protein